MTASVAVIGTGNVGLRHLETLRSFDSVKAIAVPKRPERVRSLEELGYIAVHTLDEAVALGCRLCVVASDTAEHAADSLAALERGLHVLIEKPAACDAIEASRIEERAHQLGSQVFVGCVLRFSESLQVSIEWLRRIGRLHSVHIECRSYLPDWRPLRPYRESYSSRQDEGGVLRDLIHEIDYAGWILGWPATIQARLKNLGRLSIESEEVATLLWEKPDGCTVSVSLDYLSQPPRRQFTAFGEYGCLEWNALDQTVTVDRPGTEPEVFRSIQTRDQMFASQAEAFIGAVNGQKDRRLASLQDGVRALSVCDAARRASARHSQEAVEYR